MRNALVVSLIALCLIGCESSSRGVVPLVNAHAHNDYNHTRPLLDALDCGFCSIEADVALVDGHILVTHDPKRADPQRTLESLYLRPLESRVGRDKRIYHNGPSVILLIDCKSPPRQLYQPLRELLLKHKAMLTTWENGRRHEGAVTVVLTGVHPSPAEIESESTRVVAVDGTYADIDSDVSPELMPQIAIDWKSKLSWRAYGPISDEDRHTLNDLVRRAHAHGRTIRLWNAPDWPRAWDELLRDGVDYINSDDLIGLREFLLNRATSRPYIRRTPTSSLPGPESK